MRDAQTILLTGATGFVGRHVARKLVHHGHHVRCLLRSTSNCDRLRDLRVQRVAGDIRDIASVRDAIKGCALVYHLAADYSLYSSDPRALYDTNVTGTRNLLMAAADAGCER